MVNARIAARLSDRTTIYLVLGSYMTIPVRSRVLELSVYVMVLSLRGYAGCTPRLFIPQLGRKLPFEVVSDTFVSCHLWEGRIESQEEIRNLLVRFILTFLFSSTLLILRMVDFCSSLNYQV